MWRAPSAVDGHTTNGSVGFSIGEESPSASLLAPPGTPVWRLPSPRTGSTIAWWIIIVLGGLLLLTFSLQGHRAARGSAIGVVMIWFHLAVMTVWLGGLPMLFLTLRQGDVPASVLVPRFSEAALVSVGLIIATGVYNAFAYVQTGEALLATTF